MVLVLVVAIIFALMVYYLDQRASEEHELEKRDQELRHEETMELFEDDEI